MTKQKQTKLIFSLRIAAELQERGHKIVRILQNPSHPQFDMWEFEVDSTFYEDLAKLSRRN